MKKLLLSLLMASIMLLAACAEEPAFTIPENPDGTLPSFPEEKSPLENLTEAARKTENAANAEVVYGRIVDGQEEILENYENFITNDNFLEDFCELRLMASPSNTGKIRYEVRELSRDRLYALLYGESLGESAFYGTFAKEDCTIAVEVDGEGYLSRIEYAVNLYRNADTMISSEVIYVQIRVSKN